MYRGMDMGMDSVDGHPPLGCISSIVCSPSVFASSGSVSAGAGSAAAASGADTNTSAIKKCGLGGKSQKGQWVGGLAEIYFINLLR